jgi:hypothetical protein
MVVKKYSYVGLQMYLYLEFRAAVSLQLFIARLLHVTLCVFFVITAQNIEEECLRRDTDDILDDSDMDASVNGDSDNNSRHCVSANGSTGMHHVFHKPNFCCCCLLTCVNNCSKLL